MSWEVIGGLVVALWIAAGVTHELVRLKGRKASDDRGIGLEERERK
jgi:hypothetical protein